MTQLNTRRLLVLQDRFVMHDEAIKNLDKKINDFICLLGDKIANIEERLDNRRVRLLEEERENK